MDSAFEAQGGSVSVRWKECARYLFNECEQQLALDESSTSLPDSRRGYSLRSHRGRILSSLSCCCACLMGGITVDQADKPLAFRDYSSAGHEDILTGSEGSELLSRRRAQIQIG